MKYASVAALAFAFLASRPADAQQVLIGSRKNKSVEPIVALPRVRLSPPEPAPQADQR